MRHWGRRATLACRLLACPENGRLETVDVARCRPVQVVRPTRTALKAGRPSGIDSLKRAFSHTGCILLAGDVDNFPGAARPISRSLRSVALPLAWRGKPVPLKNRCYVAYPSAAPCMGLGDRLDPNTGILTWAYTVRHSTYRCVITTARGRASLAAVKWF